MALSQIAFGLVTKNHQNFYIQLSFRIESVNVFIKAFKLPEKKLFVYHLKTEQNDQTHCVFKLVSGCCLEKKKTCKINIGCFPYLQAIVIYVISLLLCIILQCMILCDKSKHQANWETMPYLLET